MIYTLSNILKILFGSVAIIIGSFLYLGFLIILSALKKEYKNPKIYSRPSKTVYIFYNIIIIACTIISVLMQFAGLYLIYN